MTPVLTNEELLALTDEDYAAIGLTREEMAAVRLPDPAIAEAELPKAQPGPQTDFLNSEADIVVYGGAAGGGKTYGLFLDAVKDRDNSRYRFVYFRRQQTDINKNGGPWDKSMDFFPRFGAAPNKTSYKWRFPSGAEGQFASLQYDHDVLNWQTAEVDNLLFDELTHFTEDQFWYMLSRVRSISGAKKRIRAGTNPDGGSWVKKLIAPWVDERWPLSDRAQPNELRYIARDEEGALIWVDEEWRYPANAQGFRAKPKSLTFIPSKLSDNLELQKYDPEYESNLLMQNPVTAARLLHGDWSIREGSFFDGFNDSEHITPAYHTPIDMDGPDVPMWWSFSAGFDWGYSDPAAFSLKAYDETGSCHGLESWQVSNYTNERQAAKICNTLSKWGIPKDKCEIIADGTMWYRRTVNGVKAEADVEAFHREGLRMVPGDVGEIPNRHRNSAIRTALSIEGKYKSYRGYNSDLNDCLQNAKAAKHDPEQVLHDKYSHLIVAEGHALSARPELAEVPQAEPVLLYKGLPITPLKELPPELRDDAEQWGDYGDY